MLKGSCVGPLINKVRHLVPCSSGLVWEIDEFVDDLRGLVLAEIELPTAETPVPDASWLGPEVTHSLAYLNANLHKLDWRNPPY